MRSQEKSAYNVQCSCKNPIAQQAFSHLLFSSAWCICLCVVLSALSFKRLFFPLLFSPSHFFSQRENKREGRERGWSQQSGTSMTEFELQKQHSKEERESGRKRGLCFSVSVCPCFCVAGKQRKRENCFSSGGCYFEGIVEKQIWNSVSQLFFDLDGFSSHYTVVKSKCVL